MEIDKAIDLFLEELKTREVFLIDVFQGGWLVKGSEWVAKNAGNRGHFWDISKVDRTLKQFINGGDSGKDFQKWRNILQQAKNDTYY